MFAERPLSIADYSFARVFPNSINRLCADNQSFVCLLLKDVFLIEL